MATVVNIKTTGIKWRLINAKLLLRDLTVLEIIAKFICERLRQNREFSPVYEEAV